MSDYITGDQLNLWPHPLPGGQEVGLKDLTFQSCLGLLLTTPHPKAVLGAKGQTTNSLTYQKTHWEDSKDFTSCASKWGQRPQNMYFSTLQPPHQGFHNSLPACFSPSH